MIPVLLTATVNPQGMRGANFEVEERAQMYADALGWYVSLHLPVIFAENSGNIEDVRKLMKPEDAARVEWLDVSHSGYEPHHGNDASLCEVKDFDQSRGKGYNETILIHRAIETSPTLAKAKCFFKITGRLRLLNVADMLAEVEDRQRKCGSVGRRGLQFLADCKDHSLYEWLSLPINGHAGECRYWFASTEFFETMMWPKLEMMNDFTEPPVLAEDAMLRVCRETRGQAGCFDRFRTQARISGRGGHNLGSGPSFFYSTDNDSLALRLKCGLRQLLRWAMPWWRV